MNRYIDNYMTDENGVRWVKLELANEMLNPSKASPGNNAYETALNPRVWPKELHDKWHTAIPNVQLAFDGIRAWAESNTEGSGSELLEQNIIKLIALHETQLTEPEAFAMVAREAVVRHLKYALEISKS